MTAEEILKQLYEDCKAPSRTPNMTWNLINYRGMFLDPLHIDLIANLVVERLKKSEEHEVKR